eukprot:GEMP01062144.1.p1 GENE.GEMP01062144.1~~GEMP01062144.1.p1  ORF type:complete len:324 (+),score=58.03 GEMP01062144.1:353-1324(+)
MEKLGLGPDVLLQDNHRLIYARLTGFGQKGEYALRAGHDINYLALTGVLSQLCPDPTSIPHPPINLLADFAGGGMMCVVGILLALQYRSMSNMGQVVDCSMVAGVSYLSTFLFQGRDRGMINNDPAYVGKSILDGGAPFYRCYRCKDGEFISVGAIEPAFYKILLDKILLDKIPLDKICTLTLYVCKILLDNLGYSDADNLVAKQHDMESWPDVHNRLEETFVQKKRDEWSFLFKKDACVAPVLRMDEAPLHPHNIHINAFAHDAAQDPNPAPVLSGTPGRREGRVPDPGEHGVERARRSNLGRRGSRRRRVHQRRDRRTDCS